MKTLSSLFIWIMIIGFWVGPLVVCYLWGKARGRLAEKREQEARLSMKSELLRSDVSRSSGPVIRL